MKILIDSREPDKIFKYAKTLELDFEKIALPIGDIVCEEKGIVIERKSQSDFHQSMQSGHLQKQLQQMENFDHPYLIISGDIQKYMTALHFKNDRFSKGWSKAHYIGSVASCLVRYPKLKVMVVPNDEWLVRLTTKLIDKIDDGRSVSIYDTELLRNQLTEGDMTVKILTNFSGYGIIKAKKLLKDDDIASKINEFLTFMKEKGVYKPKTKA